MSFRLNSFLMVLRREQLFYWPIVVSREFIVIAGTVQMVRTATSVMKVEAIPLNVKLEREGSKDNRSCVKVTVQLPSKAVLCLV
jgi:hypothetical protein